MQKFYAGFALPDGDRILVITAEPNSYQLPVVALHGSGYSWGYHGSGPATTALSILADYFGETPSYVQRCFFGHEGHSLAWHHHQEFKRARIATIGEEVEGWVITSREITEWLEKQPPFPEEATPREEHVDEDS